MVGNVAGVQLPPRPPELRLQIPRRRYLDRDRLQNPLEVAGNTRSVNVSHADLPTVDTTDARMESQAELLSIQRDDLGDPGILICCQSHKSTAKIRILAARKGKQFLLPSGSDKVQRPNSDLTLCTSASITMWCTVLNMPGGFVQRPGMNFQSFRLRSARPLKVECPFMLVPNEEVVHDQGHRQRVTIRKMPCCIAL